MRELCCECAFCEDEREVLGLARAYVVARCAAEQPGPAGESADAMARALFLSLKERLPLAEAFPCAT